jgi:hypothetical protein
MEYYLNFNLLNETLRFHVSLPWNTFDGIDFNDLDQHLQMVVSTELFERTRKLKHTAQAPEAGSINFHQWLRYGIHNTSLPSTQSAI